MKNEENVRIKNEENVRMKNEENVRMYEQLNDRRNLNDEKANRSFKFGSN